ncbi:MAG: hypothetical protein C0591_05190 [Marinilabiliales bacterium]|nr:MAG: hypothetical protein C0591_05190 [Marinilabiliales bacterium]
MGITLINLMAMITSQKIKGAKLRIRLFFTTFLSKSINQSPLYHTNTALLNHHPISFNETPFLCNICQKSNRQIGFEGWLNLFAKEFKFILF